MQIAPVSAQGRPPGSTIVTSRSESGITFMSNAPGSSSLREASLTVPLVTDSPFSRTASSPAVTGSLNVILNPIEPEPSWRSGSPPMRAVSAPLACPDRSVDVPANCDHAPQPAPLRARTR